jgi:hypothetical protein
MKSSRWALSRRFVPHREGAGARSAPLGVNSAQPGQWPGDTQNLAPGRNPFARFSPGHFAGFEVLGYSSAAGVDHDDWTGFPRVKCLRGRRLRYPLTRLGLPRLGNGLHPSQPMLQSPPEMGRWDPRIVGIATAIKDMKCLRPAGSALEELLPGEARPCGLDEAGGVTHRAYHLSRACADKPCLDPRGWRPSGSKLCRRIKREPTFGRG